MKMRKLYKITIITVLVMLLLSAMTACGNMKLGDIISKRAKESGNVLAADTTYYLPNRNVRTIVFLDNFDTMPTSSTWDVSELQDGSVVAWITGDVEYIAGNGGVDADPDSHGIFEGCSYLTQIEFNNCFYTGNVTDMSYMFMGCNSLTTLDMSGIDTSNVTDMSYMFARCESLTALDVSGFDTANVTDMSSMFGWCESLTILDLDSFNTSNVTDMSSMFYGCSVLTALDLSNFNTANVVDMIGMFSGCVHLTSIDMNESFVILVDDSQNIAGMSNDYVKGLINSIKQSREYSN